MKYYKYINSKGVEVGYGKVRYNTDEYGLPMQNIEVPYEEYESYKNRHNRINEIDEKVNILENIALKELLNNNNQNVDIIKDIIQGLNNARPE